MVHLLDVMKEYRDNTPRVCNDDISFFATSQTSLKRKRQKKYHWDILVTYHWDISVIRHQDVSVIGLLGVTQERCSNVSKVPNHDIPIIFIYNVSIKILNNTFNDVSLDKMTVRSHDSEITWDNNSMTLPNIYGQGRTFVTKHLLRSVCYKVLH